MLLVKTKIKQSDIHGIGLFADQFIPKGTKVAQFTDGFDMKFTRDQLLTMPDAVQVYMCKYGWKGRKSKLYCLCSDDAKYFNHSTDPNTLSEYTKDQIEVVTTAIKDIVPGEEMLDNYWSFEDDAVEDNALYEIAKKFNLKDEIDPRLK